MEFPLSLQCCWSVAPVRLVPPGRDISLPETDTEGYSEPCLPETSRRPASPPFDFRFVGPLGLSLLVSFLSSPLLTYCRAITRSAVRARPGEPDKKRLRPAFGLAFFVCVRAFVAPGGVCALTGRIVDRFNRALPDAAFLRPPRTVLAYIGCGRCSPFIQVLPPASDAYWAATAPS